MTVENTSSNKEIEVHPKVQEYITRIENGEDPEEIYKGLPPVFRNAIEARIKKPKEDEKELLNEEDLIPPQYKGLPAEVLAELWIIPVYTDKNFTESQLEKKRRALEYLQKKERDDREIKILEEDNKQKLEETRKKLSPTIGKPETNIPNTEEQTLKRETLEPQEVYEKSLDGVLEKLSKEKGIVEIREGVPTVIVSDLHARKDFLEKVLALKNTYGKSALDLLKENKLNIVCVGDGMHSELAENWTTTGVHYDLNKLIAKGGPMQSKLKQYKEMIALAGRKKYEDMNPAEIYSTRRAPNISNFFESIEEDLKESLLEEEMARSFNLMKMVMDLKATYPGSFHYVRGNHDDIKETLRGFEKYDNESARVKQWTETRFGKDFLDKYASFEAALPLLAKGKDFVVSHTAPSKILEVESINNRERQAALSLTWTDNTRGGTNEDIIRQTLQNLGMNDDAKWFIGHRGVGDEKVREQFGGSLIQINHDEKQLIAVVSNGKDFNAERQVFDLKTSHSA